MPRSMDDAVRDALLKATTDSRKLILPPNLPRDTYTAVARVLKRAGGRWSKPDQATVFPPGVDAGQVQRELLSTGEAQQALEPVFVTRVEAAADSPKGVIAQALRDAVLDAQRAPDRPEVAVIDVDERAAAVMEALEAVEGIGFLEW